MFGNLLRRGDKARAKALLSLVDAKSRPNMNAMTDAVKDLTAVQLSVKMFGYDIARRLIDALPTPNGTTARHVGLSTKLSVQDDIESDWAAHWCSELQIPLVYHRKIWELAYILQAMHDEGHLYEGARALGFGCGTEPIPSYLASLGVRVTITDLPPARAQEAGWADTGQHASGLEQAHKPYLVDEARFLDRVDHRYVDMNAIPETLRDYDLCWSICALEHLGSIEQGLAFIENSLECVRPGGLSVHTTEFNINPEGPTIDNWVTVLFQQTHLEELAQRLRARGHVVAPIDLDLGKGPMDRFVDVPPWHHNLPAPLQEWIGPQYHLKVGFDGFVTTCVGIIVRKAGGPDA